MNCPICLSPATQGASTGDNQHFTCARCGRFKLSGTASSVMPSRIEKNPNLPTLLSYFVRRQQGDGSEPAVTVATLDALDRERVKTPAEQRDDLILWIGSNQPSLVHPLKTTKHDVAASIGAYKTYKADRADAEDGLQWLWQEIGNEKDFVWNDRADGLLLTMTMKGWDRFHALRRTVKDSRIAFMAMKFNDAELDGVVNDYFRAAVAKTGFELRLLSDNQAAGLIDNQLRAALHLAAVVVADLTHDNNGAYFEAGFAEGRGVPVIYTCKADKFKAVKSHFDTQHMVTIMWDPANPQPAADLLTATIRATLPTKAKMEG